MGEEIIYDENSNSFYIWNTVIDKFTLEHATREQVKDKLIKESGQWYDKNMVDGCVICQTDRLGIGSSEMMCFGIKRLRKSCSWIAKYKYTPEAIAVSKKTYMDMHELHVDEWIEEAYGQSKGLEHFKSGLRTINISGAVK